MSMQAAILRAARAQYLSMRRTLAGLDAAAAERPLTPGGYNTRQAVIHLWAWQQRSTARLQAARDGSEPVFPAWAGSNEHNTADINARIMAVHGNTPWPTARARWASGYRMFTSLGAGYSELVFLDSGAFAWLEGYSLADVYLGSYEHHLEHYLQMRGMGHN